MGCFIALLGLAMAIGGGIGWATSGAFLWWGVVCIIGILILLCFIVAASKGSAAGGIFDGIGDSIDFGGGFD